ncbi:glycosyltransferase family 4 protein [Floridanema evergladense]|uniref:Glycosyltransferase family 4 protein n=1 Tax=Floridaenema evergladense BLCC-F167 TaxID=3153639 RepID=A0ABV4WX92_9CYAN
MPILTYDYQIFGSQKYGGISRYFYELINHFILDEVFQTYVVAPLYINSYLRKIPSKSIIGYSVPTIPKTWRLIEKSNLLLSSIWFLKHTPNIIHETFYRPQKLAPSQTKTIITVHDMIHEKFSHLSRPGDKISFAKKEAVNRADWIICVSENTKKDLIDIWNIDSSKISVIYHGSSLFNFHTQESSEISSLEPYILYVGSRWNYKNFENLLRAYSNSTTLKNNFNLVCFGDRPLSNQEFTLIEELKIPRSKVVSVTGNDSKLAKFYQRASIFVYPSFYEGFGIPLLEAMSMKCPIACSNTSCFPEIAGNAAEFFDPYDFEDMANAIEKVVFSSNRTKELIKLGEERVKTFSWSACIEKTKQAYLSLA